MSLPCRQLGRYDVDDLRYRTDLQSVSRRLTLYFAYIIEQRRQLLDGNLEGAGEPRPVPRLWLGVGPLPADDSGTVDAHDLGEPFLAQANGFAALCQAVPFAG